MKHSSICIVLGGLLMIAAILIPAPGAIANDTIASIAAGGITFVKSKHIRMLEEVLWISRTAVRVRFRFLNESRRTLRTTVAFPLPPRGAPYEEEWQQAHSLLKNTFTVRVNGRLVQTQVSRKAVVGDRDVTVQLRKAGLSDEQIFETLALTANQRATLETRGLFPWKVIEALYWRQRFPPKRIVTVEHAYVPCSGGQSQIRYLTGPYVSQDLKLFPGRHPRIECFQDGMKQDVERAIRNYAEKGEDIAFVSERDLEYILGTGRNWKGPIGKFTLRIEKDLPNQFVSVCFPGEPKQVDPNTYEFQRRNFVPPDKLMVYFYTVAERVY